MRTALAKLVTLSLLACSCGSPIVTGAPAEPDDLPQLYGLPVYDVPIDEASPGILSAWETARAILADPLPSPPLDVSTDAYSAWIQGLFQPWVESQGTRIEALAEQTAPLHDGEVRDLLFALVVTAVTRDELVDQIRNMPPPAAIAENPTLLALYRSNLDATLSALASTAGSAYSQCAEVAARAPEVLSGWGPICRDRAATLQTLVGTGEGEPSVEPAPEPAPNASPSPTEPPD